MRILHWYILKEHVGPFFFAFFTITFLLVIDHFPKIFDQVIAKDLSAWIVLELVGLNLAWMLALSVPMSVLVATLMAFGRLSSDFEITAVKAAGVNLLHVLAPLMVAASVIMVGMVYFNDKVLPDLNKKARTLTSDITAMRPTLSFTAGMFITDIPGFLVLIDDIDHTTSRVEGVRITNTKDKNEPKIIIAEHGFLEVTDNGTNLQFTLYDGELHSLDVTDPENYRRMDFEKHVINVSDPRAELNRTESNYRSDREKSISEMQRNVQTSKNNMLPLRASISEALAVKYDKLFSDSVGGMGWTNLSDSTALVQMRNEVNALRRRIEGNVNQVSPLRGAVSRYQIEIYKKYSIPAASLAFILIGAPLGMLSKRGGMGMAIAMSILLFVIYWAFLIGGEDVADRGLVSPFLAMWSANILLGSIGLYLIYTVVSEKPLFSWFRRVK